MIRINKGREAREWTEYRLTGGVKYESKPELREALLKDQGYLCAYCMRRIPVRDANSNETTRIEHIKSRKKHPELELSYNNMVICCPGTITDDFHCDKLKREEDVTFDLFSDRFIDTLSYSLKDGEIKSSDETWNAEMTDLLNLNNSMLKQNRLKVIEALVQQLNKCCGSWAERDLQHMLEEWKSRHRDHDGESKYRAYCGVVIYYLKKKWSQPIWNWGMIFNQFLTIFENRIQV